MNRNDVDSISNDRKFVEILYNHYKMKKIQYEIPENATEEKENIEVDSCIYYVTALIYCMDKIQNLTDERSKVKYLNWFRWNIDVYLAEFERFETTPHLTTLITNSNIKADINMITERYFQLSETEKGISNQYVHAYESLLQRVNKKQKAFKFTGRLFLNYINLLLKRFYITKLDREEITFTQLIAESQFLEKKLESIDKELSQSIKMTMSFYIDFVDMDNSERINEDKNIELAIKLAHIRASESRLENFKRNVTETIQYIMEKLDISLNEVWNVASVPFQPVIHPLESFKSLKYFATHKVESILEIGILAKKYKWQTFGIIFGGIIVGVITSLPMLGAIYLFDLYATTISIPTFYLYTIAASSGALGLVTIPMAIASSKVVELKEKATNEIKNWQEKELKFKNEIVEEGNKIAIEALFEEHRRNLAKEAQKIAEDNIRKFRAEIYEKEKLAAKEREKQINMLNVQELNNTKQKLTESKFEIEQELKRVKDKLDKKEKEFRDTQVLLWKVREGKASALELMKNIEINSEDSNRNLP